MKKLGSLPVAAIFFATSACNHYSTQDAYEICRELVQIPEDGETPILDACVACHENCGDDCEQPRADQFVCPDQDADGTGGAGGS